MGRILQHFQTLMRLEHRSGQHIGWFPNSVLRPASAPPPPPPSQDLYVSPASEPYESADGANYEVPQG